MKIFEFIATDESGDAMTVAEDLLSSQENHERFVESMDGLSPLGESWTPINAHFDGGDGTSELDVYMFDEFIIVNARALEMFDEVEGVEFLPIGSFVELPSYVSPDMKGYIVHFTRRLSIQEGSDVEYFKGTNRIQSIEKLVLKKSDVATCGLFQIEGRDVSIYCTSKLRDELVKRGCSGVAFEPVGSKIVG